MAAFNKAKHSQVFPQTILHVLNGFCKPVLYDLKLESNRYSRGRDLILDRINYKNSY